jgi:hypothetical protein
MIFHDLLFCDSDGILLSLSVAASQILSRLIVKLGRPTEFDYINFRSFRFGLERLLLMVEKY